MSTLVTTLQAIVRDELSRLRTSELGVVEAIRPHADAADTDNYACDVRLKGSGLLLRRVPVATGHVGTVAIPNVGDQVLLAFDQGDVNQPIVVGRLYDDRDRPPPSTQDELVFRLPLAASDDKTIRAAVSNHQDASPPRRLRLELPSKITVEVDDASVRATAGKTEMRLEQAGTSGGTVTVLAGGTRITLDQDGDLVIEAAGALTLKARRALRLEGQSVSIESRSSATVEAATTATLKASASATVDGGASATLRGGAVQVRGVTAFSP